MAKLKNNGNAPPIKASESVIYTKPGGLVNLIMPHLRVKIKEEMMSLREDLDGLQIAIHNVSQGINALEAISLGLLSAKDPYAEGLSALSTYLTDADRAVYKHLTACLNAL